MSELLFIGIVVAIYAAPKIYRYVSKQRAQKQQGPLLGVVYPNDPKDKK